MAEFRNAKELERVLLDILAEQVDINNYGEVRDHRVRMNDSARLRMAGYRASLKDGLVTLHGVPVYRIERRFSRKYSKALAGYRELKPELVKIEPQDLENEPQESPEAVEESKPQETSPAPEKAEQDPEKGKTMTNKKNAEKAPEQKPQAPSILEDASVRAQQIKAAATFASKDKARPVLTALRIRAKNGAYEIAATDSYRLAVFRFGYLEKDAPEFLISAEHAAKALKASDKSVQFASFIEDSSMIKVLINNGKKVRLEFWPLIEGTFPSFEKLAPFEPIKKDGTALFVNPEFLASAGKLASTAFGSSTPLAICAQGVLKPAYFQAEKKDEGELYGLIMPIRSEKADALEKEGGKKAQDDARDFDAEKAQAVEKARLEGFDDGYTKGLEAGRKEGFSKGLEQGKKDAEKAFADRLEKDAEHIPPAPKAPGKVDALKAAGVIVADFDELSPEKPQDLEPEKPRAIDPQADDLAELAELFPGLAFTRKSEAACIWCTGDTKPRKKELKEAGFRWSAKRQAWYKQPAKKDEAA